MPQIRAVLSTVRFHGDHLERLRKAFQPAEFVHRPEEGVQDIQLALDRVDVAVIRGHVDRKFLRAPNLRWVHCDHGGLEKSASSGVFEKGLLITSSAGRSAPALAEHAMFFMLALAYNFPAFYAAQQSRQWGVEGQGQLRALRGQTVGILGMGHTGREVARRCKAFDMRVLGFRRRGDNATEHFDHVFASGRGDTMLPVLQQSDFLVLALPLTDSTMRMIGASELALMKCSAFLINVARGAIVDEGALADALREGRLAGAGLDTFEREPLPPASPLWAAPRTLITPHFTPHLADRTERSLDIICENIRRYLADEPMLNLLTPQEIYTGSARTMVRPKARRAGWKSRLRAVFKIGGGRR